MKEKTFEELITENHTDKILSGRRIITDYNTLHSLMQQVREATSEEFCQALLGANLPAETVKKIGKIVTTTDRIKLTEN